MPKPLIDPPVIGHRGAAGYAPENTLSSIRAAAALGVRWVEFDAKLTGDGQVILFHDGNLERTTNGAGRVADKPLSDLRSLDAGAWFGEPFRGERIPTLSEALATLGELELGANVEIKPDAGREEETGDAVARTLRREWPRDLPPPVVSSFQAASLVVSRALIPEYPHALLVVEAPPDWRVRLIELKCTALHCAAEKLTSDIAREIRAAGFGLRCYTVNDPGTARKLFDWGVEAVFSDYPDLFTTSDS